MTRKEWLDRFMEIQERAAEASKRLGFDVGHRFIELVDTGVEESWLAPRWKEINEILKELCTLTEEVYLPYLLKRYPDTNEYGHNMALGITGPLVSFLSVRKKNKFGVYRFSWDVLHVPEGDLGLEFCGEYKTLEEGFKATTEAARVSLVQARKEKRKPKQPPVEVEGYTTLDETGGEDALDREQVDIEGFHLIRYGMWGETKLLRKEKQVG